MFALGQKQTFAAQTGMSAKCHKRTSTRLRRCRLASHGPDVIMSEEGTGAHVVLLIASTLYTLPPVALGRYSTVQQCELARAALVEQITQNLALSEITFVCRGLPRAGK